MRNKHARLCSALYALRLSIPHTIDHMHVLQIADTCAVTLLKASHTCTAACTLMNFRRNVPSFLKLTFKFMSNDMRKHTNDSFPARCGCHITGDAGTAAGAQAGAGSAADAAQTQQHDVW